MTDAERLDWLRLYRSENVGPHSFYKLLATYGTAARALDALPDLAQRGGYGRPLRVATKAEAERELAGIAKLGARLLCASEPDFPERLAALDPAPPVIWARGRAEFFARPSVAIVGARIASAAGQRFARALAQDLGETTT